MNRKFCSFLLFVSIAVAFSLFFGGCSSNESQNPSEFDVNQKLNQDQLMVLSIPSGLKIYFGPDSSKGKSSEDGWVSIDDKNTLIDEKYFKGTTPLVISGVKPGKYLLGINPLIIIPKGFGRGEFDHTLKLVSMISSTHLPKLPETLEDVVKKGDLKGTAIYSFAPDKPGPQRVVLLAMFEDISLEKMDSLYPKKASFVFDETQFNEKTKKWVDIFKQQDINKIKELLKRGGKVVYVKGDTMILAEVKPDGRLDINFKIKVSDKK